MRYDSVVYMHVLQYNLVFYDVSEKEGFYQKPNVKAAVPFVLPKNELLFYPFC